MLEKIKSLLKALFRKEEVKVLPPTEEEEYQKFLEDVKANYTPIKAKCKLGWGNREGWIYYDVFLNLSKERMVCPQAAVLEICEKQKMNVLKVENIEVLNYWTFPEGNIFVCIN